jgi:hypothetical protein
MFRTAIVLVFALCVITYGLTRTTLAGWAVVLAWWATLLSWAMFKPRKWPARVGWIGLLAGVAGAGPVVVAQIEGRFSDEEFFAALQAAVLSSEWLALWLSVTFVSRRWFASAPQRTVPRGLVFGMLAGLALGAIATLAAYQRSFYPPTAPQYPGISAQSPFMCGETVPEAQTYDGQEVFNRLVARVEANPRKGAPEFGMLALARNDAAQARAFREALLAETQAGRFTQPANSVKFIQYQASFRLYYYDRVRAAFPDLFSAADEAELREWFAAINRRALTVEWVDWMYASALGGWPTGPYENQENGAGLLALLERTGLAAPELVSANRAYLARQPRGWAARFRNTDDAFSYQMEWINNALFQAAQTANTPLAFEWLLLQALPNGEPLRYNHAYTATLAGVAYLGATLTQDGRYLWLAGRTVDALETNGEYLSAQPGLEAAVNMSGTAPLSGSCLLYGDSGLPNQRGPLAPDKIVLRDGWDDEAAYLLLNLRFTGWHRYKAANTITLLYQQGELVSDNLSETSFSWLPVGRALFRDKRIPRENLNGLLIEQTGLSAVLYSLTGVGSEWAQDPPYYATVEHFETGEQVDVSRTTLEDWRGWRHTRTIHFYHGGLIIVEDEAIGSTGSRAALVWHSVGDVKEHDGRLVLRAGVSPVEMVVLPFNSMNTHLAAHQVEYSSASGRLNLVTVMLLDEWAGAEVSVDGLTLHITQGRHSHTVSLSFEGQ